jgi:hypothetical protein
MIKRFVTATDKISGRFKYICNKFTALRHGNVKEVLIRPKLSKLLGLKNVLKFLSENKDMNYNTIIGIMIKGFQKLGLNMTLKVNFLHSHLDYFFEKISSVLLVIKRKEFT